MLSPAEFRELVSGRRRGGGAAAMRGLLGAAEVPYALAVNWRNRCYDRGRCLIYRVSVPVISVGNLTLGGTGKTPMVRWLAQRLAERGVRTAIVSRGYGSGGREHNDEALELRQALPNVPHVQDPNRVAAAQRAIDEFGCQLVLLDDGFQHRRLARDLDIVLLDALEPFGYERIFPRGALREPLSGLRRAQVVCLSRSDTIPAADRNEIRRRAAQLAPQAIWCECIHAASALINAAGRTEPLSSLAGRRVVAFCGIGNPASFRLTLENSGCRISAWREFPDHHAYAESDLVELSRLTEAHGADAFVCTQKDLVKVASAEIAGRPLWAVAIELQFLVGREALEEKAWRVMC